jgi:carbonic anhydrase
MLVIEEKNSGASLLRCALRNAFLAGLAGASLGLAVSVFAAEPKAEPRGNGDAVIEAELRKALMGKSALGGELLVKTGDDKAPAPTKPAPAKSTAGKDGGKDGAKVAGKDAGKDPGKDGAKAAKSAKAEPSAESTPVGKKLEMPGAKVAAAGDAASAGHGAPPVLTLAVPNGGGAPIVTAHKGHKTHWGYAGATGPDAWAKLSAEFALCGRGKRQSPIDLLDQDLTPLTLEQVQFNYGPAPFAVVHNGHTIEVRPKGDNQIVARGKVYKLAQFHFHHPAEERVNGRGFDLDAHFVHKADDGELAVVSVLFDKGAANPELQRIWDRMPLDAHDTVASVEGETFNPLSMLPADRTKYLQYIGSLTTPPCTEGVVWIVLRAASTVSQPQLDLFRKMVGTNARPVQAVNGRLIKVSN